jgi:hypothetical protein
MCLFESGAQQQPQLHKDSPGAAAAIAAVAVAERTGGDVDEGEGRIAVPPAAPEATVEEEEQEECCIVRRCLFQTSLGSAHAGRPFGSVSDGSLCFCCLCFFFFFSFCDW